MIRSANIVLDEKEILDLEKVKKLLSVPNPEYATKARFGSVYGLGGIEKDLCYLAQNEFNDYLLPRNFNLYHPELLDIEDIETEVSEGSFTAPYRWNFVKSLRDYQEEFFGTFRMSYDMLLEAPCGHGKTICGAYCMSQWKCRTLILVPEYVIARQWLKTCNTFLQDVRCEIATPAKFAKTMALMSGKDAHEAPDVLIISFDLFDARLTKLTDEFCLFWGAVILDEAHVVGAPTYGSILDTIPSKRRLALTATFRRGDGMHKILQYHFGVRHTMPNRFPPATVYPLMTGITLKQFYKLDKFPGPTKPTASKKSKAQNVEMLFRFCDDYDVLCSERMNGLIEIDLELAFIKAKKVAGMSEYAGLPELLKKIRKYNEGSAMSVVDSFVAEHGRRNRILLNFCKAALDKGRSILFLSKRKGALKRFHEYFTEQGYKSALLTGDTASDELMDYIEQEAQIIFAIAQKAKQGLDIEKLDTLVLHHAMSDPEQPIGRIIRMLPDKKDTIVLFHIDEFRPYQYMYRAAQKICTNANFKPLITFDKLIELL